MNQIKFLLQLMRPYQWIKNLFCFAGVAFGKYFSLFYITQASLLFIAFCFASSAVYIFNDIIDIDVDCNHPKKRNRPLVSGKLSKTFAQYLAFSCLIVAVGVSLLISLPAFIFLIIYIVMNIGYSLKLKHVVIVDVFIISFGFLLRLLSGTIGLDILASEWLILCTLMITLLFGFAKRRSELLLCENNFVELSTIRKVLEDYNPKMLDIFIAITAACSVLSYSLFIILSNKPPILMITIFFVLYGIFRYIFKLYKHGNGQDTAHDLLDDPHLIITAIAWIAVYLSIN